MTVLRDQCGVAPGPNQWPHRLQAIRLLFLALPVTLVNANEGPDEHSARYVAVAPRRRSSTRVIPLIREDGHSLAERPFDRVILPLPAGGGVSSLTCWIRWSARTTRVRASMEMTRSPHWRGEILHHDGKIAACAIVR